MKNTPYPSLKLVRREDYIEGPITRMGLWYRFPPVSKRQVAFYIFTKLALLITLFYFVYGGGLV
jgi:hypothetical protein